MKISVPMPTSPEPVRHGWHLRGWPGFNAQMAKLANEVRRLAAADPTGYRQHPQAKLLAVVRRLIADVISTDPNAAEFQLGNTLGPQHRHWRRAKFSGRFRLFFRFHSPSATIVYASMNDAGTLRKAGGRTDPYAVFHQMLERGRPPTGWDELLDESTGLDLG
jgi:toxin YhaV